MDDESKEKLSISPVEAEEQPPELSVLLKMINDTRRQCSLYGHDHASVAEFASDLLPAIEQYAKSSGPSTFIFTKDMVIVNERPCRSSADSQELSQRLRARGAMAVTFLQDAPAEQVMEFLAFLNVEPQHVMKEGGPNLYLRTRGVSRIIATDAVYVTGDDSSLQDDPTVGRVELEQMSIDRSLLAVIDWLSRQKDRPDMPELPINDILSSPSKTAKLVREAVTKLHASRGSDESSELSADAINALKDLSADNPAKWDEATPQIRQAVLKLPEEMRPAAIEFNFRDPDEAAGVPLRKVYAYEVEEMLSRVFESSSGSDASKSIVDFAEQELLFGTRSTGLLLSWQEELQPASFIRASSRTFATLMGWETNAAEHGRIAKALSSLIPRALEVGEFELSMEIARHLVSEAERSDALRWQAANARSALQTVQVGVLKTMIQTALDKGEPHVRDTAAALVRILPDLAVRLTHLLGRPQASCLQDALKHGVALAGADAVPLLGRLLLDEESGTRDAALEVLTDMGKDSAVREIETALVSADEEFHVAALNGLAKVASPLASKICLESLRHKSSQVRRAALRALGAMEDSQSVPHLVRYARGSRLKAPGSEEQLAAIWALGHFNAPEVIECLESLETRDGFLWRSQYEAVRSAARQSLSRIEADRDSAVSMAA